MDVLIIEDETAAFENLRNILKELDSSIRIVANTESVTETVEWLRSHPSPDLIFMDIQLSDGSAFNIFNFVAVETPIVFATAYDTYAIEAFKVNSIDYLLKPIDSEAVLHALNKFKKLSHRDLQQYLEQQAGLATPQYMQTILVPHNNRLIPVHLKDIACFYTTNEKTRIVLKDKSYVYYQRSLDAILQNLDPKDFFRANKQFILSRSAIEDMTIWFDFRLLITLTVNTPEKIFVSKNKAAEFKRWVSGK